MYENLFDLFEVDQEPEGDRDLGSGEDREVGYYHGRGRVGKRGESVQRYCYPYSLLHN